MTMCRVLEICQDFRNEKLFGFTPDVFLSVFCTSVAVYFILKNIIMLCRLFFIYKINLDLIFIIFHQHFWKKHWFSCSFDSDYLAHLLQWLPPVEHCQPPWLLTLVFCKCLMKCTCFGWSPASWPQIQCVSSFRECGDVAAIGRLCHSDSVRRLRWSSFFPLSHPWRAITGPEHHGENECWMKIDAAFEFQEAALFTSGQLTQ